MERSKRKASEPGHGRRQQKEADTRIHKLGRRVCSIGIKGGRRRKANTDKKIDGLGRTPSRAHLGLHTGEPRTSALGLAGACLGLPAALAARLGVVKEAFFVVCLHVWQFGLIVVCMWFLNYLNRFLHFESWSCMFFHFHV